MDLRPGPDTGTFSTLNTWWFIDDVGAAEGDYVWNHPINGRATTRPNRPWKDDNLHSSLPMFDDLGRPQWARGDLYTFQAIHYSPAIGRLTYPPTINAGLRRGFKMTDLSVMWQTLWLGELARHLASSVGPLLPVEREVVATGSQFSIMKRVEGEPLTVASTMTLPEPSKDSAVSARTASRIFSELQDEIAIHLARAWPEGPTGMALHAWARQAGDVIELAFVASSGRDEDGIALPPFVPPPPLDRARVAG